MEGFRLEAEVHIVTGSLGAFSTIRRCLKLAEIDRYRLVMSTLAAAEATVTPSERELGVVVVDLGHALTGVACFAGGDEYSTLKVGRRHLTNDLAVLFRRNAVRPGGAAPARTRPRPARARRRPRRSTSCRSARAGPQRPAAATSAASGRGRRDGGR
ncbi:MAG: hypothetical protein U0470_14230 [Anaerolineae bacterium]